MYDASRIPTWYCLYYRYPLPENTWDFVVNTLSVIRIPRKILNTEYRSPTDPHKGEKLIKNTTAVEKDDFYIKIVNFNQFCKNKLA